MKGRRGIIEPISGGAQPPNPAGFLGVPFARSTKINPAIKAIRLEKGVLEIQAPYRPLLRGIQRYQLEMRRPSAYAARDIHITLT